MEGVGGGCGEGGAEGGGGGDARALGGADLGEVDLGPARVGGERARTLYETYAVYREAVLAGRK